MKHKPKAYTKDDLDKRRLAHLDRWALRLSPLLPIGAALLLLSVIVIVTTDTDNIMSAGTLLFIGGVGLIALGVLGKMALYMLMSLERGVQRVEDVLWDDDEASKKKKKNTNDRTT